MGTMYKRKYIKGRNIDEHRYIMEQYIGRKLERSEYVHHKNGNKRDNRIENLEIMTPLEHNRIHKEKLPKTKICKVCGKEFEPPIKHRGRNNICSKECWDKHQKELIDKEKITIKQLDKEGNILAVHTGLNEICRINRWSATNISKCLKGKIKSALVTMIFKPLECFPNHVAKTPQDIRDTFELFQLLTLKINEYMKYVPMKPDFCRLLGISMGTFNKYKNQSDSEYEDAINMVEDYIGSFTIQSAMQGSIKEISAVFATKTTLGWKDTPDQVVQNNIVVTDRTTSDMLSEYMARIPKNKDTGVIENDKEMN